MVLISTATILIEHQRPITLEHRNQLLVRIDTRLVEKIARPRAQVKGTYRRRKAASAVGAKKWMGLLQKERVGVRGGGDLLPGCRGEGGHLGIQL